jgi:hypothetical protein
MSLQTLHTLLDANLALPPETADRLTNHLPMALHALHRLGASDARLHGFFDARVQRWVGRRELPAAFVQLRERHAAALARDGTDAVLRRVLPALLPGMAAAAFHGLIRTAHAVEAGHGGELVAALAYWGWRWQPLAPPPPGEAMAMDDWTAALIEAAPEASVAGPLISIRMERATHTAPYLALAGRLRPAPDLLARLAALAVERYTATCSFTVLHMVTGLRALRVLMPWAGPGDAAGAVPVHAFVAAYLAARTVPGASAAPAPVRAWPALAAAAVASDDEHVIKFVEACSAEARVHGDGLYRQAAALALG